MRIEKWIENNTHSLSSKTVALTGATGGIGNALLKRLVSLDAKIILLDRNKERSEKLKSKYPSAKIECITLDLTDVAQVKSVTEILKERELDVIIHNAGAYKIPVFKCATGYINVFQINFLSPFYMIKELLPSLKSRGGRVVVVGSIAHNYSKTDGRDVDFSTRSKSSLIYGNAKRYLMFSLHSLFKGETDAHLAVAHPGITFTNITSHYPKWLFALIKNPMKIIFMKPERASLSIIKGIFEDTEYNTWIGPSLFNVWGYPRKQRLKSATDEEIEMISKSAQIAYEKMKNPEGLHIQA